MTTEIEIAREIENERDPKTKHNKGASIRSLIYEV